MEPYATLGPSFLRRSVAFATAFAISASSLLLGPPVVVAAGSCVGSRANFHDARVTSSFDTNGALAVISTESPTLCTGDESFSNAWSMIADPPYDAWAQTGYIREALHNGGAMSSFSQHMRPGYAPVTKWFSGPATNSVHSYQSYVADDGTIVLYIDQYQVDKTTWHPSAYWGAQPWSSQYSEETGHCASDVPGLVGDKVHFTSVKYQRPSDSLWLVPYPTSKARDCGTTYNNNVVEVDKFDFWTASP